MNEIVPRDWFSAKLKDISVLTKGLTYASVDYSDEQNGLAFLTLKSISKDGGYSPVGLKFYKGEFKEHHTLKIGDVLFANTDLTRNGDVVGSPLFFDGFGMDRTTLYSMDLSKLAVNPQKVHSKFLYYLLTTYHVKRYMVNSSAGSTVLHLDTKRVKELELNFPPLPEQKKIASILTSVDQVIENTRKKINKLQDLKKSVMIDLMNKGINHKEFKDTKLGKIPKTWNIYKYNDLLKIVDNKMEMKDDKFYSLLSIRRRNGGVFSREKLIGKKILTKTLGKAIVNTFIISKMQIVHGASGYISEKFKDHYVSSSYTQFAAKDRNKINTKFLFYYSHLDKVYKQFLLSSHGVHIEKMTFDLKDWYKKEIILPNIEEQQEIVRIIESFENHISNTEKKLEKYNFFKKSLLQDLLTGKVRVSVN